MLIIFLPIILLIICLKMVIFLLFEGFLYVSIPLRKKYTEKRIHQFHKKYPHLTIFINFDQKDIIQNIEIFYKHELFYINPQLQKDELKYILFKTKVKITDIENYWAKVCYNIQMWALDLPQNYIKI